MPLYLRAIYSISFLITFVISTYIHYMEMMWQPYKDVLYQKPDVSSTLCICGVLLLLEKNLSCPQRANCCNIIPIVIDVCKNFVLQYLALAFPWATLHYLINSLLFPNRTLCFMCRLLLSLSLVVFALYRKPNQQKIAVPHKRMAEIFSIEPTLRFKNNRLKKPGFSATYGW